MILHIPTFTHIIHYNTILDPMYGYTFPLDIRYPTYFIQERSNFAIVVSQVLELGAGAAALPSILAAHCGATVLATDGLEVRVPRGPGL